MATAAAIAARFSAELTVLHVGGVSAYRLPASKKDHERANLLLDEMVGSLRARMLNVSGVLREGVPWQEICSFAEEPTVDLVIVGSHGRSGLPRFALGSVAERVVRFSPAPVLTVHPSDHVSAGGEGSFRKILAATDFSAASLRGVDAAVDLAIELDASLTLLHVYDLASNAHGVFDDVAMEVERQVRGRLDELLASVRSRLPSVDGVVREGMPWQGILDVSKQCRADLVVMSTHGRGATPRILVGSVAERTVRHSSVPVLTLGPGASDD